MPDISVLEALLEVQRLDNELDQLDHQEAALEERAAIATLNDEISGLDRASAGAEAERDELRKRQRSLETEAGDVEQKAAALDAKLYDGSVTSPKEATALGDEISGLKARQSELEDQSIELLLELEPLDEQLDVADAARAQMSSTIEGLQGELERKVTDIEAIRTTTKTARDAAASGLDDERLAHYSKMRITYGPSAVVQFDAGRGGGCPVAMSAVELDRWKHLAAGTLEPCVDCGRLVAKLD